MKKHSLNKLFLFSAAYLVICFVWVNCRTAKARFQEDKDRERNIELALTDKQVSFIRDQVPKLLIWDHFWTDSLSEEKYRQLYQENVGKEFPVKLISTKVAVIVFIPKLSYTAITYVKMPDGRLDYPGISAWLEMYGKHEVNRSLKTLPSSTGWSVFLLLLRSSEGKTMNFSEDQKETYLKVSDRNSFTDPTTPEIPFWEIDSTITLLPLSEPSFEEMTEDKEILLNKILKAAIQEAKKSYDTGTHTTITLPNFNVGDPTVPILIESKNKDDIVVNFQLTTNPKNEPIGFAGFHMIPQDDDIRGDIVKKIKQKAIKTFEFVVN